MIDGEIKVRLPIRMGGRGHGKVRQSEKQFQQVVLEAARLLGWRCYHTFDSRHSAAGFPDLVMVKGFRLIFAELKVGKNKTTDAQRDWLADLEVVAQFTESVNAPSNVEVYVWRPEHWDDIESTLKGRP